MWMRWIPGLIIVMAVSNAAAAELFVATNGNDEWSGTLAAPNTDRTDGPLATLQAARDRVRSRVSSEPVTITVRGGTYVLDEPFVLGPEDSGSEQHNVIYAAYPGERPMVSGGRQITGWQRGPGELWQTRLPQVQEGKWYFRQLFVGGKRRQRARSPNQGYHRIARLIPGPPDPKGKPVARDQFGFAEGDIEPWKQLGDVNIILMHSWETSIHPVKSVDMQQHVVHFTAPLKEWWGIGYWEDAQRYYVENAFELLDQPGEWYLDRSTGVLSYWPLPGEDLQQVKVVAPVLPELIRLEGNADTGQLVRYVTLRGFSFQYADWLLDPRGNSSTQAAVEVPAVVTADGAVHCSIKDCEVAHIGTYGIWFRRGCKDCCVQRNSLHDLGAGGIRVGEANMARSDVAETSRTLVDNNHIYDGGHVYAAGIGIWLAQSSHNRLSHNDIHDLDYSGISVGWNWGLEKNRTHHNVIEWNHVHDLGHGVLSDEGLIYCLGVSPGSVIRNNVFHDIWPYHQPRFGWGIYLDAKCGNYLVQNNLVYNTQSGGLMFNNGGHEHVIQNNIFALSADDGLWPYNEERPSTFRHNLVYLTQGKLLVPYGERSLKQRMEAHEPLGNWDDNLYWHTDGPDALRFYHYTFDKWQALGLDQHSLIADPKFVDAAKHDFRLRSDSPAKKVGFVPFDIEQVGLYGDADWAQQVRHANCPCRPLPAPPRPPAPLSIHDGFEEQPVGAHPAHAQVSGEQEGASIRISDAQAASGARSLAVTDSATLKPSWQPHFYFQPEIPSGTVKQSFDVRIGKEAQFFVEWRDAGDYPANVGPSVRFDAQQGLTVGGRTLTSLLTQKWLHVELRMTLGNKPHGFQLSLTNADGERQTWSDLPISGSQFRELKWLGFSSTAAADAVFYIDNLAFGQTSASD